MEILSVFDAAFKPYGRVLTGYDTAALTQTLEHETPLPEGVEYVPSDAALEKLPIFADFEASIYGGMPVQLGWCNGHNTKLNCLEYHRDSEINCGSRDFILLLGLESQIEDGKFDTGLVKAFLVPAGTVVEVFATTLHYAPCSAKLGQGFKVLVALPRGTNTDKPQFAPKNYEDTLLTARNKWLLAHAESDEAKGGAVVALTGENTDIAAQL
ncbi:MAG TPA: DUF4867 family protein [Candidatus Avoscillospira stercorigallinarum]|uniref:DUF4867 family protein n=1 Tax=Candidatus Avoscillospira stercorigallinarum TaxID=2840708 RepID=A0A9D1CMW7_9FIRM|nr:DUF4867 family protein [Candidatus Avoscillospira stercorigallinarum]